MVYFTPAIDRYLAYWIRVDTWYTHQDISDNFYAFILAIDCYSPLLRNKSLTPDDPSLKNLPDRVKIRESRRRTERNPRTYDSDGFIEKVLLAITQNHPNFDQEYARHLVSELAEKAMVILDALWYSRRAPHRHIQQLDLSNFK